MSDVVFFSLVVLGFSIFYLIIKRKEGKEYKMNQQQIIQNYYIQQNISCYNYEKTINNENIFSNQLNKIVFQRILALMKKKIVILEMIIKLQNLKKVNLKYK